jgi:hypothetical protein
MWEESNSKELVFKMLNVNTYRLQFRSVYIPSAILIAYYHSDRAKRWLGPAEICFKLQTRTRVLGWSRSYTCEV